MSSYKEGGSTVLHIDKGAAAGLRVGSRGMILDGPSGETPVEGGTFTVTSVVDDSRAIAKTGLKNIGRNNRVLRLDTDRGPFLAKLYFRSGGDRRGGCAGGLTFAVTVGGRALAVALPAVELALEAGGAGALGGQVVLQAQDVILQAQDAQRRRQGVALVEQCPDPPGEG